MCLTSRRKRLRFRDSFKDRIEFDEPRSLEEAIRKLKHCYEKFKCETKTKPYWRGNVKNKGKWDKKRART